VDYEPELKKINGFIKLNDKNADAFYNRGWLYLAKGDLQMAKRDYSRAILLDKNHLEAYYNRGLVFAKMNEYTQAIRDFDEAIRLNPADVDAYCNRGSSYFQLNKMDPALRDYNKGLEIDPYDADLYYNRALVFLEKGQKPEAMKDFQNAARLGHSRDREYLKTSPSRSAKLEKVSSHEGPGETSSPGQRMDLKDLHIPESIASGKIHGEDFTVENAKINAGILTLRQGEDFFADREVKIFLFLREGENPDGRIFHVSKESNARDPHIHMKWKEKNGDVPETEMFVKYYVMRLELGTREGGKLPGRIYLALPDTLKSFVAGRFDAEIK
jgi:tetratricopeptide (TPR) repeat protein